MLTERDARLECPGWDEPGFKTDPFQWYFVRHQAGPGGILKAQDLEPIKVVETFSPVKLTNPKPGLYVYDLGQNFAGWCRLNVQGPRDTEVVLRFAETLREDGTINQDNLRDAKAMNVYILKGGGREVYEPRFTYYGFRYVEVTGFPGEPDLSSLEGRVVRSAVATAGRFNCSSELINKIQQIIVRTEANDLHSLPTDCPQRNERMAWLNDMTARAETAIYNFNLVRLYTKWLRDIRDAQDVRTGAVPDSAPFRWGDLPGDPVDCYLFVVWYVYLYYGDRRVVEEYYGSIKRWVDYLGSRADDYIVTYTLVGDWCTPIKDCFDPADTDPGPEYQGAKLASGAYPRITPGWLISTAFFYFNSVLLSRMAAVIGENLDAEKYSLQAERIREAFNEHYFDSETAQYATGSQASNALPLFLDIVPADKRDAVAANIVRDIAEKRDGHLNTGNVCTKYMFEALTRSGRGETVFEMVTKQTYPSWGFMLSRGATSFWERWEESTGQGMNSHNHPMQGSIGAWFYMYLAGIQADPDYPGWEFFRIKPYVLGDLAHAEGSIQTLRGEVRSSWKHESGTFSLEIVIPVNSGASASLPFSSDPAVLIEESGRPVWREGRFQEGGKGIEGAYLEDERVTFKLGSGVYAFLIK